jgi:hypothetical protein
VVPDEEDALEAREASQQPLDPGPQPFVHHQEAAAGVREPVLDLFGSPPAVQPHAHAAHTARSEQRHQPVGGVVGEDRQPIAAGEPEAVAQGVPGAEDPARELPVADAPLTLNQAVLVPAKPCVHDLFAQILLTILEVLERSPGHGLLDDLEGSPGAGERCYGLFVGHAGASTLGRG